MKVEKIHGFGKPSRAGVCTKMYQIVRITSFLLLAACLQVHATGYSQGTITLSEKDAPLPRVFQAIERQSDYHFFYDYPLLQKAAKISVALKDASIDQVLNACFKDQPFSYSIVGKLIVVKEKTAPDKKDIQSTDLPDPPEEIEGVVKNETGAPLAGATIEIKKLNKKAVANEKGEFVLTGIPDGKYQVDITFIGYEKYQTAVVVEHNKVKLAISLKHTTSSLDEVQIIAYGTTTKRLNTGDVTTVTSQEIEEQPVSNPILALEGRVPGMFITQQSGLPGSAAGVQVQVRGLNSMQQGNDPLYIVDGVPYVSETLISGTSGVILEGTSGNPFNFLNPADIESIDVLKDADATAIYGSRGANGVILITTKKGKEGSTRFDINAQNGFGQVSHKLKVLNNRQYLDMRYEAFHNDEVTPNPNVDYDLTLWDTTRSTDWQKKLIGGTAQYQDIQTSLSGGNQATQFLLGAGYHKETTVFPGNWNDQKGSVHFNISNSSFQKRLKIFLSGSYVLDNNDLSQTDLTQLGVQLPPDAPALYNSDGSINWAPNSLGIGTWPNDVNPIATLASKANANTNNLISNAGLSYQLLSGLAIKATMGYTYMQNNVFSDVPFAALDPSTWPSRQRLSRFTNNHNQSWIIEPQASYEKNFLGGYMTLLVGTTIEQNTTTGQVWSATGFSSDLEMQNILAATSITALSSTSEIYRYNALFGRLNYNWQDKYLLNLTIRRDGSSRFGPDNRFANFYAIGGGWIFSKETVLQKNLPALSIGKLRLSYGTTGNDQIADYGYLDLYSNIPNVGVSYEGANGIAPVSIYNPNLQWELTRKFETGLDLGFLKDRILLSANYYLNQSSNQLVNSPLPGITGFTSVEENLPAVVQNQGWEFELKTVNAATKNFRWTTSFNFTHSQNTLTRIARGLDGSIYAEDLGHPLFTNFLYHFDGVDPITGVNEFAGAGGEKVFNPNPTTDRTVVISPFPNFFGGLQNSLRYKNFQLDFLFQFVNRKSADYIYNYIPGYAYMNQPNNVLARWKHPGDVTNIQRFSENNSLVNSYGYAQQSDLAYGDGNYVRLKNISLSYQLAAKWIQQVHLQSTRVYIHAENLLTLTNYKGLDPETMSSISLPPLRIVTVGIQAAL